MSSRPRRLPNNDLGDLREIDDLLASVERELDPIAHRQPMLWDEASLRAIQALLNSSRARRLIAVILGRPRQDHTESSSAAYASCDAGVSTPP